MTRDEKVSCASPSHQEYIVFKQCLIHVIPNAPDNSAPTSFPPRVWDMSLYPWEIWRKCSIGDPRGTKKMSYANLHEKKIHDMCLQHVHIAHMQGLHQGVGYAFYVGYP